MKLALVASFHSARAAAGIRTSSASQASLINRFINPTPNFLERQALSRFPGKLEGVAPFNSSPGFSGGGGTREARWRGSSGLSKAPPPGFAWSPSPANAGEDFHRKL